MYWSLDDAIEKLTKMFDNIAFDDYCYNLGKISDYQNGTIERTLKAIVWVSNVEETDNGIEEKYSRLSMVEILNYIHWIWCCYLWVFFWS